MPQIQLSSKHFNMIRTFNYIVGILFMLVSIEARGQIEYGEGSPFEIGIASPNASNVVIDTFISSDTLYHTFNIKNIGNADLHLLNVKCSLGSMLVDYTRTAIAPSDIGIIKVAVFYHYQSGPFKRVIDFTCDGKFEHYQLMVEGYIKEE
jgi:hypothetical protein